MTLFGGPANRWLLNSRIRSIPSRRFFSFTPANRRGKSLNPEEPQDKWNYNANPFDGDVDEQLQLPLVNANNLESDTEPRNGVKMLVRDFIEDSLYNPNYGYFPKQANIFNARDSTFDFTTLRDSAEFQEAVAAKYALYDNGDIKEGPGRQLWHTPTELFQPWYGRAIGRCLVSEYLLKYFPYEDFIIYEIGAGNGTLANDVLNLLQEDYPEVYERTRYNIIEISESLVKLQKKKLQGRHRCVNINHQSIFHWKNTEPAPCFFVAMEVIDNFGHDVVRHDLLTLKPYQGLVTVNKNGDFDSVYTSVTDPLISAFLDLRRILNHKPAIHGWLMASERLRKIYASLPFAPNLSPTEYIPTRLLSLLRTLRNHFPRHRLLLSDFSSLPNAIPGYNSPVVQTRFQNVTVPCTTLHVKPGYFDIFFPTNFDRLRDMYEFTLAQRPLSRTLRSDDSTSSGRVTPLTSTASPFSLGSDFFSSYQPSNRRKPIDGVASASGLPIGERKSSVFSHSQFLETYAELDKTRLRNGENPMLEFYKNVKFLF